MPIKRTGAGHLIRWPYGPRTTRIIGLEAKGGGSLLQSQGARRLAWPDAREPSLITAKE
jgi:hypothetical protein